MVEKRETKRIRPLPKPSVAPAGEWGLLAYAAAPSRSNLAAAPPSAAAIEGLRRRPRSQDFRDKGDEEVSTPPRAICGSGRRAGDFWRTPRRRSGPPTSTAALGRPLLRRRGRPFLADGGAPAVGAAWPGPPLPLRIGGGVPRRPRRKIGGPFRALPSGGSARNFSFRPAAPLPRPAPRPEPRGRGTLAEGRHCAWGTNARSLSARDQ